MLDDVDDASHPSIMDPKDRGKPPAESREAKLAAALRANLRRRKAGGAAKPAPKPPASD
jgi:hypothetical protein